MRKAMRSLHLQTGRGRQKGTGDRGRRNRKNQGIQECAVAAGCNSGKRLRWSAPGGRRLSILVAGVKALPLTIDRLDGAQVPDNSMKFQASKAKIFRASPSLLRAGVLTCRQEERTSNTSNGGDDQVGFPFQR